MKIACWLIVLAAKSLEAEATSAKLCGRDGVLNNPGLRRGRLRPGSR